MGLKSSWILLILIPLISPWRERIDVVNGTITEKRKQQSKWEEDWF
jgi:hypothetical protein